MIVINKVKYLFVSFLIPISFLGQGNFIDTTIKSDWRIDTLFIANGNIETIYWDTIFVGGDIDIVNVGADLKSSKGILFETFRRDTLKETYTQSFFDDFGKCIQTVIVEGDYRVALYYYENGRIKCLQNYRNGKKDGYSLWFNLDGTIQLKELYEEDKLIRKWTLSQSQ